MAESSWEITLPVRGDLAEDGDLFNKVFGGKTTSNVFFITHGVAGIILPSPVKLQVIEGRVLLGSGF